MRAWAPATAKRSCDYQPRPTALDDGDLLFKPICEVSRRSRKPLVDQWLPQTVDLFKLDVTLKEGANGQMRLSIGAHFDASS
jgi:hypothetical protein